MVLGPTRGSVYLSPRGISQADEIDALKNIVN